MLHSGKILREGTPAGLLAEFDDVVLELAIADRRAVDPVLDADPRVIAATPAGATLKVVVRAADVDALTETLRELGARVTRSTPSFEDVYLGAAA
jgi:ABC-2 type transport system ATP-binding protein